MSALFVLTLALLLVLAIYCMLRVGLNKPFFLSHSKILSPPPNTQKKKKTSVETSYNFQSGAFQTFSKLESWKVRNPGPPSNSSAVVRR